MAGTAHRCCTTREKALQQEKGPLEILQAGQGSPHACVCGFGPDSPSAVSRRLAYTWEGCPEDRGARVVGEPRAAVRHHGSRLNSQEKGNLRAPWPSCRRPGPAPIPRRPSDSDVEFTDFIGFLGGCPAPCSPALHTHSRCWYPFSPFPPEVSFFHHVSFITGQFWGLGVGGPSFKDT